MVKHLKPVRAHGSELFFVEIADPSEVRKNLLESLREILEVLHRFEKFKHMRHEKLERIHKLRLSLRQANKLMTLLKSKFPQTNLKPTTMKSTVQRPAKKDDGKKQGAKPEEKPKKKPMTELEKLESELSAIEDKLKNLA